MRENAAYSVLLFLMMMIKKIDSKNGKTETRPTRHQTSKKSNKEVTQNQTKSFEWEDEEKK